MSARALTIISLQYVRRRHFHDFLQNHREHARPLGARLQPDKNRIFRHFSPVKSCCCCRYRPIAASAEDAGLRRVRPVSSVTSTVRTISPCAWHESAVKCHRDARSSRRKTSPTHFPGKFTRCRFCRLMFGSNRAFWLEKTAPFAALAHACWDSIWWLVKTSQRWAGTITFGCVLIGWPSYISFTSKTWQQYRRFK